MGYRCRWLATRTSDRDAVLKRLGYKLVGELVEEVYDTGLYALEVDGWLVVIGDGFDHMNGVKRAQARKLGDALYLYTDDAAMAFELALFTGGDEAWAVAYDGSDGVTAPTVEGPLPMEARAWIARLEKQQASAGGPKAEVDHVYDFAPQYAKHLVGFRHDESLRSGDHVPIWQLAVKR